MNDVSQIIHKRRRLPAWIVGARHHDEEGAAAAHRDYDRLGVFIFRHGLGLTAVNLDIGLRFVLGNDEAVRQRIDALLDQHGRLTDAMIEQIADEIAPQRRELRSAAIDHHRDEASRLRDELQRARREAERDHLTGLPNRRCFETRVRAASESGERGEGSKVVALCDIDDFKAVNDEHGHQTGDRVLRLVGAHLERELDGKALVARHGGEEFALFFHMLEVGVAVAVIDQARERLGARALTDQETGRAIQRLTFSAGVAPLADDVGAAMRAADRALYSAKRAGKDRVLLSDAATDAAD